ncbi:MAG: alanine racemase [Oscillospiraceae bacterium]|nr:alanine racemase [Oscillospiraceae bacterium]
MKNFYKRTWSEVNLDVLKQNIAKIRELSCGKEIIAIVKANAYGHGDVQCSKSLNGCGVRHFAVSNLWEAQNLSDNGIEGEILIFGYCDIPMILENTNKNYIFTVGDTDYAKELSDAALANNIKIPVHIKIDTGMSRVGITAAEQLDFILSQSGLDCRAAYTHFAVSDSLEPSDVEFTTKQQTTLIEMCKKRGLSTHSQNSGGIINHGEFEGELVRAGIIMYGQKPDERFPIPEGIRPIFSLKSVISQLKTIHAGDTVSYGRTFTADRDVKLALIPCGYADGFNRRLSGNWSVMINGTPAPVCGRICMDQTLVDVTGVPDVKLGDIVTVYSNEIDGGCSVTEAAHRIGTINYELLCAVGTRVPRIYTENGKPIEMHRYI